MIDKKIFALPILIGIGIGSITTGVIIVARDDFYWYRNAYNVNHANTSIDAVFIEDMIPHHEGAIAMATLAQTSAKSDVVRTLATRIITAQTEEITTMQAWYFTWFGTSIPQTKTMDSNENDIHALHMDTVSGDENALKNAKDFDKTFLEQMIPHHEMAIMMARMLLRATSREEMKALAQNIITTQTAEITEMKTALKKINE